MRAFNAENINNFLAAQSNYLGVKSYKIKSHKIIK